jgi:hypothetical protein
VLIWFGSEFPLSLFPSESDPAEYREEAKKTLDLFANNQIAVYPVDVSGVMVAETYGGAITRLRTLRRTRTLTVIFDTSR